MQLNLLLPHVLLDVLLNCEFGLAGDIDPEFIWGVGCLPLLIDPWLDDEGIA